MTMNNSTQLLPQMTETQAAEQSHADSQPDADATFELALEDRFADQGQQQILASTETQSGQEQKAEAGSMPNVLVDEELLKEIASIPDRFGFKIGDVADMLGIKQYVLRYWEQEFDLLRPKKASNNQRLYTKKDVENAYLIRKLLYRDKFSIEGARRALKDVKFAVKKEKDFHTVVLKIENVQEQIRGFINEIRKTKNFFN